MMEMLLHPMILPITLPVVAGVVCLLLPRQLHKVRDIIAVGASAVTLLLALRLLVALRGGGLYTFAACPLVNLRLDALSGFVMVAIALFGVLSALYSLGYMAGRERLNEYYAYLLWTVGISCGAVLANHFLLLLIFWGMLGVTLYLMIGMGGSKASAAAKKTFIVIGGSDCLLMLGIAIAWHVTGRMLMDEVTLTMTRKLNVLAFLCFTVAALAKAGAMPFHSWVPDCGEKAPLSVSAFLPASLDKLLGIYLLARTMHGLFVASYALRVLLMLVGAATVMCAVMMALVQHDLRRLLAYHAVSQVGYMVLGIASGTAIGMAGGLFHMLNHAMYKSSLFMCAGSVERQAGTCDLDRLGGLGRAMPITFVSCLVAAMAISGVPPLNGFASKWMVYQGIIEAGNQSGPWVIWIVAAMFGSALTLASFVKILHAVFLRKPPAEAERRNVSEVGFSMWFPTAFLGLMCLVFGVFWKRLPYTFLVEPAVVGEVTIPGLWWGAPAALVLLAGIAAGLVIYALTTARKPRVCATYIGGELMEAADIPGEARSDSRDVEVSGVDFYRTIETMAPFRGFYAAARQKAFDIYDVGTKILFYFVDILRAAHTGLLPTYLTWLVAGMLFVVWWLVRAGGG